MYTLPSILPLVLFVTINCLLEDPGADQSPLEVSRGIGGIDGWKTRPRVNGTVVWMKDRHSAMGLSVSNGYLVGQYILLITNPLTPDERREARSWNT